MYVSVAFVNPFVCEHPLYTLAMRELANLEELIKDCTWAATLTIFGHEYYIGITSLEGC